MRAICVLGRTMPTSTCEQLMSISVSLVAGVARVDITPERPLDLSGVPARRIAGVLDRLEAQVLVLRDTSDGRTAVLATLDTLYVPRDWGDAVRRRIGKVVAIADDGVALDAVMLAASHTHAAPGLQTLRQWGTADPQYRSYVADRLVKCAAAATDDLRPVQVRLGTSELATVSYNRRTPNGPIDPTVTLIGITETSGRPLAAIVGFACHPVTLWGYHNQVTPDFPGYLRRELGEVFGPDGVVMYVNGAAGNLNPAAFDHQHVGVNYSRRIASEIAKAASQAWHNAAPIATSPLETARVERSLRLDPLPSSDQLDAIVRREEEFVRANPEQPLAEDRLQRTLQWARDVRQTINGNNLPDRDVLELQAIRMGDLLVMAVPGELYVEIGRKLQETSPLRHLLIAGYANGMLGYLCTRAWQEQAGSQEKFISLRLRSLSVDTEDAIYEAASSLLANWKDANWRNAPC
jgi:neutral ceramidase